jgi:hypothetical protein
MEKTDKLIIEKIPKNFDTKLIQNFWNSYRSSPQGIKKFGDPDLYEQPDKTYIPIYTFFAKNIFSLIENNKILKLYTTFGNSYIIKCINNNPEINKITDPIILNACKDYLFIAPRIDDYGYIIITLMVIS